MTIIFGSRALNLSAKRRKAIAEMVRAARAKGSERYVLNTMLALGEYKPVDTSTPPRTERERYEDRCSERDANTQRALNQYDSHYSGG